MTARWEVRKIDGWWTVSRHGVIVVLAPTRELAVEQGRRIAAGIEHSIGAAS